MHLSVLLAFFVVVFCVGSVKSSVPASPCPDIFRYVKSDDGTHYGEINVPAKSGKLHVKMFTTKPIQSTASRPKLVSFGGNEDNERKSLFRVDFPYQDPLPQVDKITVDSGVVCTGNKDPSAKITSSFELSQSSYRTSSSRTIGGGSGSGSRSHSSFYRNHTYSYNTRT